MKNYITRRKIVFDNVWELKHHRWWLNILDLPSHRAPLSLNTSLESNCFDTRSSRRRPLGSSRRPFFFSGLRIPCRVISEYLWTRLDHFSLNRLLLFVWYTAATVSRRFESVVSDYYTGYPAEFSPKTSKYAVGTRHRLLSRDRLTHRLSLRSPRRYCPPVIFHYLPKKNHQSINR